MRSVGSGEGGKGDLSLLWQLNWEHSFYKSHAAGQVCRQNYCCKRDGLNGESRCTDEKRKVTGSKLKGRRERYNPREGRKEGELPKSSFSPPVIELARPSRRRRPRPRPRPRPPPPVYSISLPRISKFPLSVKRRQASIPPSLLFICSRNMQVCR